jgi:hypothetical protein
MARILRVVWSTNRLEYLIPTLASHACNINFGDHTVYHMLIDDYPLGRRDWAVADVVQRYGFDEVVLHPENLGITLNWTRLWQWIQSQDFDYVWHHEDDVVFNQAVNINELIALLESDPSLCQVNLKRNPWYEFEFHEPLVTADDQQFGNWLYNCHTDYFWTMSSLYRADLTQHVGSILESQGCNLGEAPVMRYFLEQCGMKMAVIKNLDGSPVVEHIGVYSQGRRVLPNEPGWAGFSYQDPNKRYNSRTGQLFDK